MQGTIKKKISDKNFGFIGQEGGEKDLFFHANELNGVSFEDLHEGDTVSFEVKQGDKGPSAVNVQKS
ncbi:cold shock domain-containing protein [Candidatus Parcubacteria bacterium]|nr:MAG: cold shock domain-containing protein [Candidatus Parcubacteria bacterium]